MVSCAQEPLLTHKSSGENLLDFLKVANEEGFFVHIVAVMRLYAAPVRFSEW